ncbi:MAG: hypothetical protein VX265_09015 [Myxococcota bacterium]|nr:hypothetical protein [Myxococcota bacterium]MEC8425334.1 hypothetical protein [Myxococcota bacterium]
MYRTAACAALAIGLTACKNEQGIAEIRIEQVAAVAGDFDRLESSLFRNGVQTELYEGYINAPVYDVDEDAEIGVTPLQVERLFSETDADGEPLLYSFDALFLNSGTRGLGQFVYNDVDPDDALVTDPAVVETLRAYVARRRTVVASDWSYDLIEQAWPERITFLEESQGLDAAQRGTSRSVVARVTDEALADALGNSQLEVFFDFSYWSVMQSVGRGVTVHLRGDVEYRPTDGSSAARLVDVPLLVSFEHEGGRVILSSFAWRAQRQVVADTLMLTMVEGLAVETTGDQTGGGPDASR